MNAFLVFGSFAFVAFLMIFGVLILMAPDLNHPDADEPQGGAE